jgi:hypothetical protein
VLSTQEPTTQPRRPWLIAAIFAFILFLGNVAVEVLGEDLKEWLRPYRLWVWLVLPISLLVTVIGAVREARKPQEPGGAPPNGTPNMGAGSIVTSGDVTGSNQITGNNNTINQGGGGNADSRVKVSVNNYLSPETSAKAAGRAINNTGDAEHSGVHWENRDTTLLRDFLAKCAEHDSLYKDHERWHDRDVREHLIASGLATEDPNGQTYLTRDGVLLCCQRGKIPQADFHVDVRFKQITINDEPARQFNGCSVLLLYNQLLKELAPLFERGVELPSTRDEYGSAVSVFDYPKVAIIEALVNLLIHRDYSQDDMGFITVYPDRVVFENPGQSEFPIEELLTATEPLRPRYPRNQRLIQAFNEARLNQREGRGIQRIREALRRNGSFREDGLIGLEIENDAARNRFRLTIYKRPQTTPRRPDENQLGAAVERLLMGTGDQNDERAVRQALLEGRVAYSAGDASVEIGGDVSGALIITGDRNPVTGHYNTIQLGLGESQYEQLREHIFPRPLGIPPPFPPLHFLGRDDALRDVKRLLGVGNQDVSGVRVAVVRGWPGVGKTTFASVLSRDPDVARVYPDGVLWASLGTQPELMSILVNWGRALGHDNLLRTVLPEDGARELATLLQDKRMLLIVDDVWEGAHGALFRSMIGRHCGLLFTTRLPEVADTLAPDERAVYRLPILGEEDALKLMLLLAPEVVAKHQDECRELVRSLECLPLALHVAARLLRAESRQGWGVTELLSNLREGTALVMAYAPADRAERATIPTVRALLSTSTDVLDERTRDCFAYLGAFAPKPATFDLEAMKAVWQVDDPKPIIRNLVNHGLLEPVGNRRFQMHALLVAHAQSLLEEG